MCTCVDALCGGGGEHTDRKRKRTYVMHYAYTHTYDTPIEMNACMLSQVVSGGRRRATAAAAAAASSDMAY